MKTTLNKVSIGTYVTLSELNLNKNVKRRLRDLGLIKDTLIKPVYKSPLNDPVAYLIRESVIAIRNSDAKKIIVTQGKKDEKTSQ